MDSVLFDSKIGTSLKRRKLNISESHTCKSSYMYVTQYTSTYRKFNRNSSDQIGCNKERVDRHQAVNSSCRAKCTYSNSRRDFPFAIKINY